jgi:ribosomal protein L15
MGYDKLLGTGVPSQAYNITISAASAKAVEKVEAAGGEIING